MRLSRSSYYLKVKKVRKNDVDTKDIIINDIALEHPYYSYRRVTAALKRKNLIINHKKVYRIMKDNNILCKIKKSFKKTTNSAHNYKKYKNLIKDMVVDRSDQI